MISLLSGWVARSEGCSEVDGAAAGDGDGGDGGTVGAAVDEVGSADGDPVSVSPSSSVRASLMIRRGSYCRGSSLRQSTSSSSGPSSSRSWSRAPLAILRKVLTR